MDAAPPTKKRKKAVAAASAPLVPVEVTLEPGVSYQNATLPPAPDARAFQRAHTYGVLAPRELQNAHTLVVPEEGFPLVDLLAHDNMWHAQDPADALRVVAADELLDMVEAIDRHKEAARRGTASAAPAIEPPPAAGGPAGFASSASSARLARPVTVDSGALTATPAQQGQRYIERGLVDPAAATQALADAAAQSTKALSAMQRVHVLNAVDTERRRLQYFVDDDEIDADLPFGLEPHRYPMGQQLMAEYHLAVDAQTDALKNLSKAPRPIVEAVSMTYINAQRFEATGLRRACSKGASGQCIVQQLAYKDKAPNFAYAMMEFLEPPRLRQWEANRKRGLPVTEANDGPVGLCFDDTLIAYGERVHLNESLKDVPVEQFNTFTVLVNERNFDRRAMIPQFDGSRFLGVLGHVPAFAAIARQFTMETPPNDPGKRVPFLKIVGQDFWSSLSEANACLGIPKLRPLLGAGVRRVHRVSHQDAPAVFLSQQGSSTGGQAWTRFVDALPTCILADRTLLATLALAPDVTRVPAAWLRRSLHLSLPQCGPAASAFGSPAHLHIHHYIVRHVLPIRSLGEAFFNLFESTDVLAELAEAALGTFEHSVSAFLNGLRGGRARDAFTLAPLAILLGPDATWRGRLGHFADGLPLPAALAAAFATGDMAAMVRAITGEGAQAPAPNASQSGDGGELPSPPTYVIWLVCLWRISVALLLLHVVRPFDDNAGDDAVYAYQTRLFISTHYDLLAYGLLACAPGRDERAFCDESLLLNGARGVCGRLYPQCNRVLCIEELPGFAGGGLLYAANPWFDKGNIKSQETIVQAILQIIIYKAKNSVCQRRNHTPILLRQSATYPAFRTTIRLIVHCIALGHLPRAVSPPSLVAALRIHTSFSPSLGVYTPEAFDLWVHGHSLTTMFMLREFFIATAEADYVLDNIYAQSTKWTHFKELVRLANGDYRREVEEQTRVRGPYVPIDWRPVEYMEHGTNAKGKEVVTVHTGRMLEFHDKASSMNIKLKKGRWEELMLKKMRAIETEFQYNSSEIGPWAAEYDAAVQEAEAKWQALLATWRAEVAAVPDEAAARPKMPEKPDPEHNLAPWQVDMVLHHRNSTYSIESIRAWLGERLEIVHAAAWYVARRTFAPDASVRAHAVVELRWLKVAGMTRRGYDDMVARWQFEYYMYDCADDNMKAKTASLYAHEPRDEALLKLFLVLVDTYRRDRVSLTSLDMMRAQMHALRDAFAFEGWAATVPRLGVLHYCRGCRSWAHHVERPLAEAVLLENGSPDAHRRYMEWVAKNQQVAALPLHKPLQQDLLTSLQLGLVRTRRTTTAAAAAAAIVLDDIADAEDGAPPAPIPPPQAVQMKRMGMGAVASTTRCYYNPLDGLLYCRRGYHHAGTTGLAWDAEDVDDDVDDDEDEDEEAAAAKQLARERAMEEEEAQEGALPPAASNTKGLGQWAQRLVAGAVGGGSKPKKECIDIAAMVLERKDRCKAPLVLIDMPGVLKQVHNRTYALCVRCGRPTECANATMTNAGPTCGMHLLLEEYGAFSPHWRIVEQPHALVKRAAYHLTGVAKHGSVGACAGPCYVCQEPTSVTQVWAYDVLWGLTRVALCRLHKTLLHSLLPLQDAAAKHVAAPPVRVDTLLHVAMGGRAIDASV